MSVELKLVKTKLSVIKMKTTSSNKFWVANEFFLTKEPKVNELITYQFNQK